MKKRILWVTWHQTPYHDFLLDKMGKCFEMEIIYLRQKLASHPWTYADETKIISWDDKKARRAIINKIKADHYDLRVLVGWDHALTVFSAFFFILTNRPYFILCDTPNVNKKRSFFRWLYHLLVVPIIVRNLTGVLVTGKIGEHNFKAIHGENVNTVNFPFATDIDFFKPSTYFDVAPVPTIITVGRLVNSHKGFDVSLHAIKKIRDRNPMLAFKFLIIGSGPDEGELVKLIEENNLKDFVQLIGWQEPNQMLSYYQQGYFYVHPSHFDPFPNTVLEAMACGLPVIGSDGAGSVLERVKEGVNGFVFHDNDVYQLSMLIEKFLHLPHEQVLQFKKAARQTAEEWTYQFNIDQLNKLF